MQTPLQVTFRHMDHSPAVEARVRELAQRLEHFYARITGCHVVVEGPAAHRHKGAPYTVRIDVVVPGRNLHIDSERDAHREHADVYVALRDAFDMARRLLEDYVRAERGDVKHHESARHSGSIAELHTQDDFGRIEADDGRLIYFHRNSLHDATFDSLKIGARVRFEEEEGDQGPQAAAVRCA